MKKFILGLLLIFLTLFTYGQVNYCDSIEISITSQTSTSVEFSSTIPTLNMLTSISYDWSLTDDSGIVIGTDTAASPIFSMPNPMNSDTNYICLMTIFYNPAMTFTCITCDTVIWNGTSWMLLSMMPPPCNLTGGSVYIDHTSSPWMMNASVNGMSIYEVLWSNGSIGNQTPFYTNWCVSITDIISGCDTIICESCIPDTMAVCPCPMIYMPVCGCDGNMYGNDCIAICADIYSFTPAIPSAGGFLPCTQPNSCIDSSLINLTVLCASIWDPVCGCDSVTYSNDCEALNWFGVSSWTQGACNVIPNFACMGGVVPGITTCVGPGNYAMGQTNVMAVYPTMAACIADSCTVTPPPPPCTVEINNGTVDIEICDGDTTILEATTGFDTYLWTLASTGATLGTTHIIEVTDPGLYIVIVTDSTNCVDMDSIEVIVYPVTSLNPMTVPNPPMVCLGDSVVIEVNQGFVNYWWNTGNPLDQGEDRVVIYPTQDFTYVVEALDINGCESREEIEVFVDTCATGIMNIIGSQVIIYPNPTGGIMTINLPKNEVFDLVIFDISGKLVLSEEKVMNNFIIADNLLSNGTYIMKLIHNSGLITKKIVFE